MSGGKAENNVFIGDKPFMSYIMAVVLKINQNPEVIIKARGRWISRAIDVVEVVRNDFVKEAKLKNIDIGSDEFNDDGKKSRISTIELTLSKN